MKYFLIGIGGVGMSGLARLLAARGHAVSGADGSASAETEKLTREGIKVMVGHAAANLPEGTDLVVATGALTADNPELAAARARQLPIKTRGQVIGELMTDSYGIAVAGTHGKTTTTGMVAKILTDAGLDPTCLIGGALPEFGSNVRIGAGKYLLTEADEYSRTFLDLAPTAAIITNIDADHLDYFKDLDEIVAVFKQFVRLIPPQGTLVINGDLELTSRVAKDTAGELVTFGQDQSNRFVIADIARASDGTAFTIDHEGTRFSIKLAVPGLHNVANATAAFALCLTLGVDPVSITRSLAAFGGVERRFEVKEAGGFTCVDDYAHHPAEIMATLDAARQAFPDRKLLVVFEPHQHSRTLKLLDRFGASFGAADEVIVAPIFRVRDSDQDARAVKAEDLVAVINANSGNARFVGGPEEIAAYVKANYNPREWVVFTMGAGPITALSGQFK